MSPSSRRKSTELRQRLLVNDSLTPENSMAESEHTYNDEITLEYSQTDKKDSVKVQETSLNS